MNRYPTIELGTLFTAAELEQMIEMAKRYPPFAPALVDELHGFLKPRMEHIAKVTGQENDSRYLAYAISFALSREVAR